MRITRLGDGPIIRTDTHPSIGTNIQGPSLIRMPEWAEGGVGSLAAAYSKAFGDSTWAPELLLDATAPHIASPDLHVDYEHRRFVMYFHGLAGLGVQLTKVAVSTDGVHFIGRPEVIARPYVRAFHHDGLVHALAMPGVMYRSADGMTDFERGPSLFSPQMRHSAVVVRPGDHHDVLHVLWTRRRRRMSLRLLRRRRGIGYRARRDRLAWHYRDNERNTR